MHQPASDPCCRDFLSQHGKSGPWFSNVQLVPHTGATKTCKLCIHAPSCSRSCNEYSVCRRAPPTGTQSPKPNHILANSVPAHRRLLQKRSKKSAQKCPPHLHERIPVLLPKHVAAVERAQDGLQRRGARALLRHPLLVQRERLLKELICQHLVMSLLAGTHRACQQQPACGMCARVEILYFERPGV